LLLLLLLLLFSCSLSVRLTTENLKQNTVALFLQVEWLLYSADVNPTKRNAAGHTAVHAALRRFQLAAASASPDLAVLELLLSGATSDYVYFHTLTTAATSHDICRCSLFQPVRLKLLTLLSAFQLNTTVCLEPKLRLLHH
jgi:hypothetical protein